MIEKLVASSNEHLSNNVLIDIAEIGRQFVGKEFLIDDILGDVLVPEGKGDKKACVANKHLILAVICIEWHTDIRVIGMMGEINSKTIFEVLEKFVHGVLLLTAAKDAGDLIAGGVLVEFGGNSHKET